MIYAVVQWLSLLHNFIQQSLNSGSPQIQILLVACQRFEMVRIYDNAWLEIRLNALCQSTIPHKQFIIIFITTSQYYHILLYFDFIKIGNGPVASSQSFKLNKNKLEMFVIIYIILWPNIMLILARIQWKCQKSN